MHKIMRHMMSDFTIAVAPQIADSDQGVIELSVLIGRDVTLYCRVTAGAPTPSIEWMHDNGTIEWTPEGAVLKEGGVSSLLPSELQSLRLEERRTGAAPRRSDAIGRRGVELQGEQCSGDGQQGILAQRARFVNWDLINYCLLI